MNFQWLVLVDFPHGPGTGFEHWRQLRALIGGFLLGYNYHSLLNESIQQCDAIISLFLIPPQLALVCWICFNWEGRGEVEPLSSLPLFTHHRERKYSIFFLILEKKYKKTNTGLGTCNVNIS